MQTVDPGLRCAGGSAGVPASKRGRGPRGVGVADRLLVHEGIGSHDLGGAATDRLGHGDGDAGGLARARRQPRRHAVSAGDTRLSGRVDAVRPALRRFASAGGRPVRVAERRPTLDRVRARAFDPDRLALRRSQLRRLLHGTRHRHRRVRHGERAALAGERACRRGDAPDRPVRGARSRRRRRARRHLPDRRDRRPHARRRPGRDRSEARPHLRHPDRGRRRDGGRQPQAVLASARAGPVLGQPGRRRRQFRGGDGVHVSHRADRPCGRLHAGLAVGGRCGCRGCVAAMGALGARRGVVQLSPPVPERWWAGRLGERRLHRPDDRSDAAAGRAARVRSARRRRRHTSRR